MARLIFKIVFIFLLFLFSRLFPRVAQRLCASLPHLLILFQCSKLGSHLNTLLDHYQQFQEVAESLRTWLQESEAALGELLSETVPSDVAVLQQQLASIKVQGIPGNCWSLDGNLAALSRQQQGGDLTCWGFFGVEGKDSPVDVVVLQFRWGQIFPSFLNDLVTKCKGSLRGNPELHECGNPALILVCPV